MAEDNLKDFTVNWIITGLLLTCLLAFAITFMANNNPLGLGDDADYVFNNTYTNLNTQLLEVDTESNELLNIYDKASVFLNTTTVSSLPTVILEAMAMEIPVVSTATCLIPKIVIEHGVNGFVSNDIRELRNYCNNAGIKFIWRTDEFYANQAVVGEYSPGQLIMLCDLKPVPRISGSQVADINYRGLIGIGRKFDSTGIAANLDENALQKYDRRMLELTQLLILHSTTFACNNNLILEFGELDYLFNFYAENIDFVVCQSANFEQ